MNKDVMWLVFVLIIVGIVFGFQRKNINLFSPKNGQESSRPFSLFPESTEGPPPEIPAEIPPPQNGAAPSAPPAPAKPPALRLSLGQVYSTNPSQEYVVLEHFDFDNKQAVNISGMKLQNRDRVSGTLGKDEYGNNIYLNYGERATVATGASPLGKNFKLNKCSGYFNQNNSLPVYASCPSLSDIPQPKNLNNKCIEYIEGLSSCAVPTINADTGIDNACTEFVSQHASYTGCVADHKNDSDFDKRHWLVYLGKGAEMWGQKRDLVQLFDQLGKLITEISY